MRCAEDGPGGAQRIQPLLFRPVPETLPTAQHLAVHHALYLTNHLFGIPLMPKAKDVRNWYVKAGKASPCSVRFPGSWIVDAACMALAQMFRGLPFFRCGWAPVVVLGNNGHPPTPRVPIWSRLKTSDHGAPPFRWLSTPAQFCARIILTTHLSYLSPLKTI